MEDKHFQNRLMPRPSARTKKFCLGQKQICPDKIIFVMDKIFSPRLKSHDQSFCKTKQFSSQLRSPFLLEKNHLQGLLKSKSGLFNHGQNILSRTKHFCPGQFRFCPGQKIFCLCRRTRHHSLSLSEMPKVQFKGRLVPRPSAWTKKFCLGQKLICPGQNHFCSSQNFLSEVEKSCTVLL